jgi:hypothetical protein
LRGILVGKLLEWIEKQRQLILGDLQRFLLGIGKYSWNLGPYLGHNFFLKTTFFATWQQPSQLIFGCQQLSGLAI